MAQGNNPNSNKHDAKGAMAFLLALIATFFGAPELYHHTVDLVTAYAESRYGHEFVWLALVGWGFLVAAFTFYAAHMSFDIAFVSAIVALLMRLV